MRQFTTMARSWLVWLVVVVAAGRAVAAPEAELWEKWTAHDPDSTTVIDHGVWSALLGRYVVADRASGINLFDYGAVTPEDRSGLVAYIQRMAATPISTYSRAEQFAYWANLYNALTVNVVLDAYPVDSIRDIDISPGWFSDGPWGKALVMVEGEELSLDDIEHRILRPIWQDPRIHYAVNCASMGCPQLYPKAFTPASMEAMLDQAAHDYVNHPRGVTVKGDGGLTLSSIYDWYGGDFGKDEAGIIAHLVRHAEPSLAESLKAATGIDGYDYDWALNDAARISRR